VVLSRGSSPTFGRGFFGRRGSASYVWRYAFRLPDWPNDSSKAAFITGFSVVLVPVLMRLFGGAASARGLAGAFASLAGYYS